ncbi:MAG: GTP-binding protein [Spirochaetia bacterium]
MDESQISLWILGGFLGSGKTTLLNRLLEQLNEQSIGVIVNDFGELGIDASLIDGRSDEEVVELNGGQIFCSCLSGSFVQSIVKLAQHDLDVILVESSGLAKPSALKNIVEEAQTLTGGQIVYKGMIVLVDAERFEDLLDVVNAVEEQIYYADLVVINKTDLVSTSTIETMQRTIENINPDCSILNTTYGSIGIDALPSEPIEFTTEESSKFRGWGDMGRPKAVTWCPNKIFSDAELAAVVREVSANTFRIKGYLTTKEGPRFVSASGTQVTIEPASAEGKKEGLTVIAPPRLITANLFSQAINEYGGTQSATT